MPLLSGCIIYHLVHVQTPITDQFTPVKVQSRKIHLPWLTPAIKCLINKNSVSLGK